MCAMAPVGVALFGLVVVCAAAGEGAGEVGCTITAKACRNFPEFARKQFRDELGEEHLEAGSNEAACLKRAEDFHHWCGNGAEASGTDAEQSTAVQVAATYNPNKWSQLYHPGACAPGWSQWDAFCYQFHLDLRTWFEAEKICRDLDSHLVSVHSKAENNFIHALAQGLKVWIGYTDVNKDTHYEWSDNTQDDFTNFAKNCTGREHEPDCKKEEVQQQWFKGRGTDTSPFVCKKTALLPVGLFLNTSAQNLTGISWLTLLPSSAGAVQEAEAATAVIKIQEIVRAGPAGGKAGVVADAVAPEKRLLVPKGSLL